MTMSSSQTYNAGDVLTADSLTKHVTEATPTVLTAAVDGNSQDITALDEIGLVDSAANATSAGRVRRNGANPTWHDGTSAGRLFYAGGTDVPVADGGTGISSGTSGGVPYFSGTTTIASSALLTLNAIMLGGGAGAAPTSMTGTSGGVPYFNAATTVASSGALTANRIVLGGGAGAAPTVLGSLGTTTTLLHGNAAGAPSFSAVSLTADVSGTLPVANGGTGVTTSTGTTNVVLSGSPTIVTPTIASFTNATHNHEAAAGGGQLSATSVFSAGTVPTARLGSGSATSSTFLRGDQTWAAAGVTELWLPASVFNTETGSPTLAAGSSSVRAPRWQLDSASAEFVMTSVSVPTGWGGSAATLQIWWANDGAGSGDVRVFAQAYTAAEGSATRTLLFSGSTDVTAGAQDAFITTEVSLTALTAAQNIEILIGRQGSEAADTLGNDAGFYGALLSKA